MNFQFVAFSLRLLVLLLALCAIAACGSGQMEESGPISSADGEPFILYHDTLENAIVAEVSDRSEAYTLAFKDDSLEPGDAVVNVDCADDGSQAAYVIANGLEDRLLIAGSDGSKTVNLPGGIRGLDWAPDGQHIAVATVDPDTSEFRIMTVDAASGQTEVLTFGRGLANWPRWSPDGGAITYDAFDGGTNQVFVVRPGEGDPEKLTNRESGAFYPDWSTDSEIIFGSHTESGGQLFKVALSGEAERAMPTSDVDKTFPRTSPDRLRIAYVGTIVPPQISTRPLARHNVGVYTAAADGTGEELFTDLAKDAWLIGWCMGGDWLQGNWARR